jgi:hypothetical protein
VPTHHHLTAIRPHRVAAACRYTPLPEAPRGTADHRILAQSTSWSATESRHPHHKLGCRQSTPTKPTGPRPQVLGAPRTDPRCTHSPSCTGTRPPHSCRMRRSSRGRCNLTKRSRLAPVQGGTTGGRTKKGHAEQEVNTSTAGSTNKEEWAALQPRTCLREQAHC